MVTRRYLESHLIETPIEQSEERSPAKEWKHWQAWNLRLSEPEGRVKPFDEPAPSHEEKLSALELASLEKDGERYGCNPNASPVYRGYGI